MWFAFYITNVVIHPENQMFAWKKRSPGGGGERGAGSGGQGERLSTLTFAMKVAVGAAIS